MDYMTAGELAQSVGITLRAVQYYDQLGLLSPSERGSNNLRLYSQKEQQQLYLILVLKYLGLTLSQIRETLDEYDTNEAVAQLIDARLEAVEAEFHDLFKRLQALTSASNRDFAERARALLTTSDGHVSSSFLVMGSTFPHSCSHEGFDALSSSVTTYIQSVIDANNPLPEEERDL